MHLALFLLACSGPSSNDIVEQPIETSLPTSVTAMTGDTAVAVASLCTSTVNSLRFECPGTGTIEWWPADDPTQVRTGNAMGSYVIWGLRPDVDTIVRLPDGVETFVQPGGLPARIANASTLAAGANLSGPIAMPGPCEGKDLIVVDELGRIIWYEEFQAPIAAIDVTPTGTFLVLIGGARVIELDVQGNALLNVAEYDRPLHHDLTRDEAGYTYVLNAGEHTIDGDKYVLDGLYVIGPDGELAAEWDLRDHLPNGVVDPESRGFYWEARFPGATDFSHGNSVEATSDGNLVLSFRWLDSVMTIAGDPTSADFGTPQWVLAAPQGDLSSDFALVGDNAEFTGQHHVTVDEQGRAWMFDNGGEDIPSRGLRLDLDGGTATQSGSWAMEAHCAVQGAAYPTPDDGVLLTCSGRGEVVEFAPAEVEPRWMMEIDCLTGPRVLTNRAVPVGWDG